MDLEVEILEAVVHLEIGKKARQNINEPNGLTQNAIGPNNDRSVGFCS